MGRGDRRRWPDLVLEQQGRRVAVEIEFAPRGSARLGAIADAYLQSVVFNEVRFLLSDPATARTGPDRRGRDRRHADP